MMRWRFIGRRSASAEATRGSKADGADPKVQALARGDYRWFCPMTTRWSDNDIYGHVNNVVYYSYFDSVANRYLIEEGGAGYSQRDRTWAWWSTQLQLPRAARLPAVSGRRPAC
jgi:hypothetical protein